MKRMLSSPSTSPEVSWPMEREPRARDPRAESQRDARRAAVEPGAEKMDRTVRRHDRRFSRDQLRNLRGASVIDEDDTQWWVV